MILLTPLLTSPVLYPPPWDGGQVVGILAYMYWSSLLRYKTTTVFQYGSLNSLNPECSGFQFT